MNTRWTASKDKSTPRRIYPHKWNRDNAKTSATTLRATISNSLQHAMGLAKEKGASSWLTSLPLEELGFTLHKSTFRDAIALRYGWQPLHTPTTCACGTTFSVGARTIMSKEWFSQQYDTMKSETLRQIWCPQCVHRTNLTANHWRGSLRHFGITEDGARLDIAASGFWGEHFERAFFDMRIFNLHAPSNRQTLSACYRKHENIKKRAYQQRVWEVQHSSFTCLSLKVSEMLPQFATRCLPHCYPANGTSPTAVLSPGSDVVCPFPSYALQSSVQEVPALPAAAGAYNQPFPPIDLVSTEAKISSSL